MKTKYKVKEKKIPLAVFDIVKRHIDKSIEYNENLILDCSKQIETHKQEIVDWDKLKEKFVKLQKDVPDLELINNYNPKSAEFLSKETFSVNKNDLFLLRLTTTGDLVAIRRYSLHKIDGKSVKVFKDQAFVSLARLSEARYDYQNRKYTAEFTYIKKHWKELLQHKKAKKIIQHMVDVVSNQEKYKINYTWINTPERIKKLMNFS